MSRINIFASLLYCVFFAFPIYLSYSGGWQLVDIPLILLLGYSLFNGGWLRNSIGCSFSAYNIFVALLLIMIIILLPHSMFGDAKDAWTLILYYVYGLMIFTTFYNFFSNYCSVGNFARCYDIMLRCVYFSFIVPLFFLFLHGHNNPREILSFNDPNQLVFYCLLVMSILYYMVLMAEEIGFVIKKRRFRFTFLAINLCMLFVMLSASRSGISLITVYFVLAYKLLYQNVSKDLRKIYWFFFGLGGTLIIIFGYIKFYHYIATVRHISANSLGVAESIYDRGFMGLSHDFSRPLYFLFGTGMISRYGNNLEFHNNFVGIFHQTGIFCFLLYLLLCGKILWDLFRRGFLYTLPFFVYLFVSFFLFTFRTRFSWAFIAITLFVVAPQYLRFSRKQHR